jgi:hypothetical protein
MSLVNIHLQPDRAWIAVDTEVLTANAGKYGHGSKMTLLPQANAVLAIRGLNVVLGFVFTNALAAWPSTFDALVTAVPQFLRQTLDYLDENAMQLLGRSAEEAHAFDQEVSLIGYSEERGRMCAFVFSSKGSKQVDVFELEERDAHISPWAAAWGEPIDPSTTEYMRFLALFQVDRGGEMEPTAPLGGQLLLCELTKGDAKFSSLGLLTEQR